MHGVYVTGFAEFEGSGSKFGEPKKKIEIRSHSSNLKFKPERQTWTNSNLIQTRTWKRIWTKINANLNEFFLRFNGFFTVFGNSSSCSKMNILKQK